MSKNENWCPDKILHNGVWLTGHTMYINLTRFQEMRIRQRNKIPHTDANSPYYLPSFVTIKAEDWR